MKVQTVVFEFSSGDEAVAGERIHVMKGLEEAVAGGGLLRACSVRERLPESFEKDDFV